MRSRGWGKAWVILPHDGAHGDKVFATSYESAIREAGFDVLGCTVRTIKAHRHRVMEKMQVRTLPELVSLAERVVPLCILSPLI